MKKEILKNLESSISSINLIKDEKILKKIEKVIKVILNSLKKNGKILLCGNGGSAAHAQHFAAEYVGKFEKKRKPISAIALSTDTSLITSISNDFKFKYIFSKQVEAIGKKGDILLCYSTSGSSENVIEAAKIGKKKGLTVIAHTGSNKSLLSKFADINIYSPSTRTSTIQECQIIIDHLICRIIEKRSS